MAQGGNYVDMLLPEEDKMLVFKDYNDNLFVGTFIKSEDMFFICENLQKDMSGDFNYSRYVKAWTYINI
tara:strand:- start:46 stop:252 length:207 start_codon:yes stop_codon:yes gene_type:complete